MNQFPSNEKSSMLAKFVGLETLITTSFAKSIAVRAAWYKANLPPVSEFLDRLANEENT